MFAYAWNSLGASLISIRMYATHLIDDKNDFYLIFLFYES